MKLKKNIKFFVTLFCLFSLFFSGFCFAAATPDPTAQMKPFVQKITKMISDADFKTDLHCTMCQRIIDVSRERFDYKEMSKRVLGKTWRSLSVKEKEQFVDLFTELLEYAYIGKIENYSKQAVIFKQHRIKGKRAEVKTELVDGNNTIPVSYIMLLEGDQWMVYDVVVEGVSLIRNYMEQFQQIVRQDKYAGLVRQIEEKIKELADERAKRFTEQQG